MRRASEQAEHVRSAREGSSQAYGHGYAEREPYVSRVLCYDGSPAIDCPAAQAGAARCCANQGGVYHDAWGNVVMR